MADRLQIIYMVLNFLFLCTGGLILGFSVVFNPATAATGPARDIDAGTGLLLGSTPIAGGLLNAVLIFITFIVSLPGMLRRENRTFIKAQSWLLLLCGLISLVLGLTIWFGTLRTRSNLAGTWGIQTPEMTSALQEQFKCCGYTDLVSPPFVTDAICVDDQTARQLGPCVAPFSSFANSLLDLVFTTMFGCVALDMLTFLAAVVVLKDRAERKRYMLIEQKYGKGGF